MFGRFLCLRGSGCPSARLVGKQTSGLLCSRSLVPTFSGLLKLELRLTFPDGLLFLMLTRSQDILIGSRKAWEYLGLVRSLVVFEAWGRIRSIAPGLFLRFTTILAQGAARSFSFCFSSGISSRVGSVGKDDIGLGTVIQVLGSYPIGLSLCQFQTRESRQSVIGEDPEVLKGVIDICCGRLVLLVMVDSGCIEILSGEDIQLMTSLGVNSYRFSVSWSRVLPRGRFGGINYSGIQYYNRLIDALISRGIKPFVTLNHLDYPQELENRFQSWLSSEMQNDFGYLADVCFKHFGDRVKHWTTLNEPNQQIILTHLKGTFPPSRCSLPYGNCSQGNSETEPFIAAHNAILGHARAVHIYRGKYKKAQRGIIGIVVQTSWFEPISDSIADKEAAERAQSFYSNWILDPIIYGKYPKEMVNVLGSALPRFSRKEVENLKQSRLDFIGINHYTSYFVQDCLLSTCNTGDGASKAQGFALKLDRQGNVSIGELTDVNWQHIHPEGFRKILNYLKIRYRNVPMFITENGFGDLQKPETTLKQLLNDTKRIQYMSGYLDALQSGMR
ncbi:hypothetical protein Bca101_062077 [Brassica carinata]